VAAWNGGACRAVTGARLAPPWAAFVNGTAAHAEDFDDVLEVASAHVSAVLVPALIAEAGVRPMSAERFLEAYLAGFEVLARLGEAFGLVHYARGWHTTLTLGTPAAAAAVAVARGLEAEGIATAISQSMSMAAGSKAHMGKIAKPVHAGLAAKAGIVAAALAEAGTTANSEIFAGPWGAIEMMAGPTAPGFRPLERLPSAMTEHGVWLKAYPTCASTHRVVDGALALARDVDAIDRVDLTLPLTASQNLMFEVPRTPGEARFSAHYCVAHALREGQLGPSAFDPARIGRPDLLELMRRIHRQVTPSQTKPGADLDDLSARIEIQWRDGSCQGKTVAIPYGHPGRPLDDADLDAKFIACAEAGGMAANAAGRLLGRLRALRGQSDLSEFDWFQMEDDA
jgi:2-methylcitrate dehydratase PrpD